MGPIWGTIMKALKLLAQAGPYLYVIVKYGKKVYQVLKESPTGQVVVNGVSYTRKEIKKLISKPQTDNKDD